MNGRLKALKGNMEVLPDIHYEETYYNKKPAFLYQGSGSIHRVSDRHLIQDGIAEKDYIHQTWWSIAVRSRSVGTMGQRKHGYADAGKTVLMISVQLLKGNISSQSLGNG